MKGQHVVCLLALTLIAVGCVAYNEKPKGPARPVDPVTPHVPSRDGSVKLDPVKPSDELIVREPAQPVSRATVTQEYLRPRGEPSPIAAMGAIARRGLTAVKVLYRVPEYLVVEEPKRFELVLATKDLAAAQKDIAGEGAAVEHTVKVSPRVRAELVGDPAYVTITPLSSPERDLTDTANAKWEWSVTGKKAAEKAELTLRVYNVVEADGVTRLVDWDQTYEDGFQIRLTNQSLVKRIWELFAAGWAWLVAAVPVIIAVAAWCRRRLSPAQPQRPRWQRPSRSSGG